MTDASDTRTSPGLEPLRRDGDLLPCPFCGSPASLVETPGYGLEIYCDGEDCPAYMNVTEYRQPIAIKRWNARAPLPGAVAQTPKVPVIDPADAIYYEGYEQARSDLSETTPTKEDFAKWSRAWHDTCETMVTLLGLPGNGSPQELLAQVQSYVGPAKKACDTDFDEYPYDDERFNKGVEHVVHLLAKTIGATNWYAGDGSEDYDEDLAQTLLNILAAKDLFDPDTGCFAVVKSADVGPSVPSTEAS